jgi:hypothetical protein
LAEELLLRDGKLARGYTGADLDATEARMQIDIRVECHAGYRADERPLRFVLRGRLFEVSEVEDRWYSPGATYFRVRAEDGNFYVLRHDEGMDVWTLDAFRTSREYEITPQPLDVTTPPGPHGAS